MEITVVTVVFILLTLVAMIIIIMHIYMHTRDMSMSNTMSVLPV